ncbi:MAG TPA: hypothetical protein VE866_15260 [Candidatus Binatia bacterium]|jgi:hypothetical protein|nr:hypothetical protein [Candidatus Binatia bacterium]
MHYADGTPAKAGDLVVKRIPEGQKGTELIGFLRSGQASASSCNGNLDVIAVRDVSDLGISDWRAVNYTGWCVTINEFLPIAVPALPAPAPAAA